MNTKAIYLLLLFISFNSGFSQMSGNVVYSTNRNSDYATNSGTGFNLTDNNLTFKVKILMNKKADRFQVILGLNEEANTVESCNSQINQRIDGFVGKLSKLGIKKEDYYIDFISQTKVYDYTITTNKAEQFEKGFEIKKNIIIATKSLKNIDEMIEIASQFKIYDIIKIDYFSDNSSQIYDDLFEEAIKIAATKKDKYLKAFNKRTVGNPTASDQFFVITPESQYKNYKAYESSEFETYYNSSNATVMKKIARKNNTFYYDGTSQVDVDKVINNSSPEVGIQYVLTLNIS
ncbi:MAG: SIMPL domain-containing protein, partial [Flavobacteriaceae bacterium]|nr:SIMPL domain-containing protein [Flavobacteriaceae bacterium]